MADINLLKTQDSVVDQGFGFIAKLIAKLLMVVLVLVLLAYGGLYFYTKSNTKKLGEIQNSIKTAQADALNKEGRSELLVRQQQLTKLETLVDNHMYWSKLIPELARVTIKSAQYTSIEAKSDGKLNLTVTLPNYAEIEKYMQIFDLSEYREQFSNVRIVSIGTVQTEGSILTQLRLQLMFDPEFIKNPENKEDKQ